MAISKEQSIGKIGEHLVCADLLGQGYMAFIVAEGLNYDVLLDDRGKIYRVQVRSTRKPKEYKRERDGIVYVCSTYRFYIRQGKKGKNKVEQYDVDVFAFVALDKKQIAYIPYYDILNKSGKIKSLIEFRDNNKWGKSLDQFSEFPSQDRLKNGFGWLPRIDAHLSPEQVEEIRAKYKPYKYTAKMLAKEYDVSEGVIRNAVNEKYAYLHNLDRDGIFGGKRGNEVDGVKMPWDDS